MTSGAPSRAFAEDLTDGRLTVWGEDGRPVREVPLDPVQRLTEGQIFVPFLPLAPAAGASGTVGAGAAAAGLRFAPVP